MPKFNFNLRNPKAGRPTPVYLIIRYKKYRVVYPTGERILPLYWDRQNQRQKTLSDEPEMGPYDLSPDQKKVYQSAKNFNQRLHEIEGIARQVFDNFVKQNDKEEPEPKEYKLLLDVELEKQELIRKDIFTFLKNFIEEKKKIATEKGTEHQRGALHRNYAQLYIHLTDFAAFANMKLDFKDIDIDFYYSFADYLRNRKNLLPNTIGKHIKSLKTILNSATESGLNSNMIFKSKLFKAITEKVTLQFLEPPELDMIAELDLSKYIHLDQVRDIFLISARTGLRDSEFSRIHAIHPDRGTIEITDSQHKDVIPLPLHPDLNRIIEKHKSLSENDLHPVISNLKMNAYIKQVCSKIPHFHEQTEIELKKRNKGVRTIITNAKKYELISMQTARRSFFINRYNEGVNVYLLMAISGHKSHDNFLRFIHVTQYEYARTIKENL